MITSALILCYNNIMLCYKKFGMPSFLVLDFVELNQWEKEREGGRDQSVAFACF